MDWYLYGVVFLVAATVTFVLTPYAIKAAKHYGIVDLPGENRVNTKPVPRFGGTSLFLGVMFSLATLVVIFTAMPQALSNLKVMPNINYVGIFFAISLV